MPANVQPYLNFEGSAEEALGLYKKVLGAEVTMLMRCGEAPPGSGPTPKPEFKDKILHAAFRIGASTLFASDGYNSGAAKFDGVSLSVEAKDAAEAKRIYDGLADGGTPFMPLSKTFFSDSFGMLKDKFGLTWMVTVPAPAN